MYNNIINHSHSEASVKQYHNQPQVKNTGLANVSIIRPQILYNQPNNQTCFTGHLGVFIYQEQKHS